MADYDDRAGVSSTSSAHGHNIPILLEIENYSIWATRMRFSLGGLQAVGLIDADQPRISNRGFSTANVRLTGQALSLMTSKINDAAMDLAGGAETGKELWSRLYAKYHEKGWGAESIFFEKLVQLRHSDCESTGDYIGKFCSFSQRLSNMGRACENWWLVYLFFSRLGDKHSTWATSFRNASRKELDSPLINVVTVQLLDESRLIGKPGTSQSGMALFGSTSKKRRFNSSLPAQSARSKSTYNKAIEKCSHCKKSFHEAIDRWILHLELARSGWIPPASGPTQANISNDPNAINFMSVLALLPQYSSANENYGHHAHNESMLADDHHSFNTFILSSITVENNDMNFDEFITNYEAISHASTSDKWEEKRNVKDDSHDNADEFVVERIPKQPQKVELPLAIQTIVHETESMVRKNVGERTENERSQVVLEISEPRTTAVNIPSIVIPEDIPDPNWHISFMALIKKRILHFYLTRILLKTGSTSPSLRYLQNLWHIDSGAINHICVSRQRCIKYHFISQEEDIWTGEGSVRAIGKGIIRMELTKLDGSHSFITVHDVLHIPMFMTNLISVSLL